MPKYEYMEMTYLHHARREGLERLNELGADGWAPAFAVGRTLVLVREAEEEEEDLPVADVEDWRGIYPTLPEETFHDLDADGVAEIMGRDFELPTRSTLNRWADEAKESAGAG